jgi:outer membrane protein TolC
MKRALTPIALAVALSGCAGFSQDAGFSSVQKVAQDRLKAQALWQQDDKDKTTAAQRVRELAARTLSVDDAVQIALLNNRGLQAAYADLRIAEANLVDAGKLPNPHFAMLRTSKLESGVREFKIEQALTFNVFSLVTMPQMVNIERRRLEATQRAVALEMLRLASDTKKAYYNAIAAEQSLLYRKQVADAALASAELARRMARVGNFNKLQQAREQSFYADAALNVGRAEQAAIAAREKLARLLGLADGLSAIKLPDRLPDLPPQASDQPDVEQVALDQRMDLQQVRLQVQALAANLGLMKSTRLINVLELGPARVLEGQRGDAYKKGFEVAFELPIFDWGTARVVRAEAIYNQALNVATQMVVEARSEVREAYLGYRTSYDVARHLRDEIVPLRKRISEENLLRYNGMLIGVFELLADTRSQIAAVDSAIQAQRDFWVAQADLEMAMIGKPTLSGAIGAMAQADGASPAH